MQILILGAGGMLGHKLCRVLAERMEVWGTVHNGVEDYKKFNILPADRLIGHVDVTDIAHVAAILDQVKPDVVINGVGIVKQRDEAKQAVPSIKVNALFPHQMADVCEERGIRAVQVSTDCVFSGFRGNYTEIDVPDPIDLYGRTKLLGELNRPGCLTIRTSIIGWQLNTFSSLLSWFALQRNKSIKGYRKAIYSGFSTQVLAQLIADIIQTRPELNGLYQIASEPISKYDLLMQFKDILGWTDIKIDPDDQFFCDRSLTSTHFNSTTGWRSPSWQTMLEELASEWTSYKPIYFPKS
jgi:dTDP-4-dehydrorhamnose reductase